MEVLYSVVYLSDKSVSSSEDEVTSMLALHPPSQKIASPIEQQHQIGLQQRKFVVEYVPAKRVAIVASDVIVASYEDEEGNAVPYVESVFPSLPETFEDGDRIAAVFAPSMDAKVVEGLQDLVKSYSSAMGKPAEVCILKAGGGGLRGWLVDKGLCGDNGEDGGGAAAATAPAPVQERDLAEEGGNDEQVPRLATLPEYTFRCRGCRTLLFDSNHVNECQLECSTYLLNHPSPLTANLGYDVNEGKLYCVNSKCKKKVGAWKWSGIMCGCKKFWGGGIVVVKSMVDENATTSARTSIDKIGIS